MVAPPAGAGPPQLPRLPNNRSTSANNGAGPTPVKWRASIAYYQNEFTVIGGIPRTTAGTERVFGVRVGLKYQIVRSSSSTLMYDYSRTDSTGTIADDRVRIFLDAAF
jgi:hypothetical protein